jgi:hypothetical protein
MSAFGGKADMLRDDGMSALDPKRTRTPLLTSFAAWRAAMQTSTGNRTRNGGRLQRDFNNIRVRSFILTGAPTSYLISIQNFCAIFCLLTLGLFGAAPGQHPRRVHCKRGLIES